MTNSDGGFQFDFQQPEKPVGQANGSSDSRARDGSI